MHIFISAYVLLALASWSALAVPLSGSGNENVAAQKHSSSSILMGKRDINPFFKTAHVPSQSSTVDCGSKSKSQSTSKDNGKTDNNQPFSTGVNLTPTTTVTGPLPAIARRDFRSPMRLGSNGSPDIFERDDAHTTGASGNPITVDDVLNYYFGQGLAGRKRAERPRTSRGFY